MVHEGCGVRLSCRRRGGRSGASQIRMVPRAEECETRYPCYRHAQHVHRLALSPDDVPATSDSFSSSFGLLSPSRGYSQTERCGEVLTLHGKTHVSRTSACSNTRNTIERHQQKQRLCSSLASRKTRSEERCRGSTKSWRPFRHSTGKDGASSRKMRDTLLLLHACVVCPWSAALSS